MPRSEEWTGDAPTFKELESARKWRIGMAAFFCLVAFACGMAALVELLK